MTAAAFQAVGTAVGGTGTLSPSWPAHAVDDIAILIVEHRTAGSDGGAATLSTPAGFAPISGAADLTSAAGTFARITAFWCRATSAAMTAPTVADSYDSGVAVIATFRGCIASGNPVNVASVASNTTSNSAISVDGATTTVAEAMIVIAVGAIALGTVSGWANASLISVTERLDTSATDWVAIATGVMASEGTYGATTATHTFGVPWAGVTIALNGIATVPGSLSAPRTDGRVWLKPGQFAAVRGSTQQNRGIPSDVPSYAPPLAWQRLERPWQPPGFGVKLKGSTQYTRGGESTPTPSPMRGLQRPWLKPGQFARTQGSTVNTLPYVFFPGYWGPHFPPRGSLTYWDGHFPEGVSTLVPGVNPDGAATFVLVLQEGVTVKYAWMTGLFKSFNGKERRSSIVDDPAQRFDGEAILINDETRAARSRLARYAAIGTPFLLGLPYEELTFRADAATTTVYVQSTAQADWCAPGARVVLRHAKYGGAEAVVQSYTSNSITLDVAPGNVGRVGGSIMPAMAIYLDPQQRFDRYATDEAIERWHVAGRNVNAGFSSSATSASLALGGASTGVTLTYPTAGAVGNAWSVQFVSDAVSNPYVTIAGSTLVYHFRPNIDTVASMAIAIEGTSLMLVTGPRPLTVMTGADVFGPTALSGGADASALPVGIGAVVATFASRPVWDRRVDVMSLAPDSLQSMTEAQDLGGLPFIAGQASVPDWGRSLVLVRELGGEWQWIKKFLDTVKGRFKSFWLASWRPDLVYVSKAAGSVTVTSGENAGDVFAWWPQHRTYLQIWQADGTLTYVRITAAVDNGNGTVTLTIVDAADAAVTLSGSAVSMVSWLELVRLESDEVTVTFSDFNFAVSLTARVVQR